MADETLEQKTEGTEVFILTSVMCRHFNRNVESIKVNGDYRSFCNATNKFECRDSYGGRCPSESYEPIK